MATSGMSAVPSIVSMALATAELMMQWAHGYSGCIGVLSIGCHVASRSVASLPSMSPLRMAVIGRQNAYLYLASMKAIAASASAQDQSRPPAPPALVGMGLPEVPPEQVGMSKQKLDRIHDALKQHVADGKLPGTVMLGETPMLAPSPYFGDEKIWDAQTSPHSLYYDEKARVWFAARI